MSTSERQLIRAAMERLLAGDPIRSDGALTIVSLAEEAGLKRHYLTHKHTDLRDEFYARVRAQGKVPESEVKLRQQLKGVEARLEAARRQLQVATQERDALLRLNNLLATENRQLTAAHREPNSIIPFNSRRDR
ncbi:hypothetical protein KIV56_00890 [Cryobacterium breve]|uniref:TetR family transcriptional regulator n=1 Tax=Cryobacterium breve TaxID=1259258 RepID=A0ABY7NCC9_9MICO|nr:hypothetical protein [Cryobacterium breve]WBM80177.1 hypothetical protein KIV56_00890 [Cryobacterium breve]